MKAHNTLAILSLALFLTSCSLTQQVSPVTVPDTEQATATDEAAREKAKADAPAPSDAQQKAAEQILEGEAPASPEAETPAPAPLQSNSALPGGGLRMGSIIPQEDPASTGEAPPPAPNSVELRGLRSPKMPSSLPMGIDGKLKSGQ